MTSVCEERVINERYILTKYRDSRLIVDGAKCFINATKLAEDAGKKYVNFLESNLWSVFKEKMYMYDHISYDIGAAVIEDNDDSTLITGTYVHPLCCCLLAAWCSSDKLYVNTIKLVLGFFSKSPERRQQFKKLIDGNQSFESRDSTFYPYQIMRRMVLHMGGAGELRTVTRVWFNATHLCKCHNEELANFEAHDSIVDLLEYNATTSNDSRHIESLMIECEIIDYGEESRYGKYYDNVLFLRLAMLLDEKCNVFISRMAMEYVLRHNEPMINLSIEGASTMLQRQQPASLLREDKKLLDMPTEAIETQTLRLENECLREALARNKILDKTFGKVVRKKVEWFAKQMPLKNHEIVEKTCEIETLKRANESIRRELMKKDTSTAAISSLDADTINNCVDSLVDSLVDAVDDVSASTNVDDDAVDSLVDAIADSVDSLIDAVDDDAVDDGGVASLIDDATNVGFDDNASTRSNDRALNKEKVLILKDMIDNYEDMVVVQDKIKDCKDVIVTIKDEELSDMKKIIDTQNEKIVALKREIEEKNDLIEAKIDATMDVELQLSALKRENDAMNDKINGLEMQLVGMSDATTRIDDVYEYEDDNDVYGYDDDDDDNDNYYEDDEKEREADDEEEEADDEAYNDNEDCVESVEIIGTAGGGCVSSVECEMCDEMRARVTRLENKLQNFDEIQWKRQQISDLVSKNNVHLVECLMIYKRVNDNSVHICRRKLSCLWAPVISAKFEKIYHWLLTNNATLDFNLARQSIRQKLQRLRNKVVLRQTKLTFHGVRDDEILSRLVEESVKIVYEELLLSTFPYQCNNKIIEKSKIGGNSIDEEIMECRGDARLDNTEKLVYENIYTFVFENYKKKLHAYNTV